MTFQQAVQNLQPQLTARQQQRLKRFLDAAARRPRLWAAAEQLVAHCYERRTGKKLRGAIDWQTIWQWFVQNAPLVLQLVLSILTIFAKTGE
jgi:hypothetical protein